jgi:cellobiose phosphorylase
MNKVGAHGTGESVWNGWFILAVLKAFAELADRRGDAARAGWCRLRTEELRTALEDHAWDGAWYRRAYFDDGTPLGSARNDECQIDALPQAWSVISGAADPGRSAKAMAAVDERLVDLKGKLIRLFTPPFDAGKLQPGYIKGYVPGIRENGGQYTHGVTWVILATALQGRCDRAVELWNLLNPVNHARTPADVEHYKVEPYVICADVYGAPPHTGRGGWTWYTGAAGWMYRVAVEAMLGLQVRGDHFRVDPTIPNEWPRFELSYRRGGTTYLIAVENPDGVSRGVLAVELDGTRLPSVDIPLVDDGGQHHVAARLGRVDDGQVA